MHCYRITGAQYSFLIARSCEQALAHAKQAKAEAGEESEAISVQEWCGTDLRSLYESEAFQGLSPEQRLTVVIREAITTIAEMKRQTEYLELSVLIEQVERGIV